jgi:hypothetical protein
MFDVGDSTEFCECGAGAKGDNGDWRMCAVEPDIGALRVSEGATEDSKAIGAIQASVVEALS